MNINALAEAIGLDEEDYRELVELFLETGKADFDQLKAALAEGNAETVSRKAHTLCGAAGNLGIMDVYEAAKRIELTALDHQLDGLSADMNALEGQFVEIARCLAG